MWSQVYDPFGSMVLSTAVAAIPIFVLLGGIGLFELRAHVAALLGLAAALAVAIFAYGMPIKMAGLAAGYGAAFGLLPIGWIILNVIFLYQLTSEKGEFEVLRRSIGAISDDRRLQVLFVAFCLGAFFEGAAMLWLVDDTTSLSGLVRGYLETLERAIYIGTEGDT